MDAPDILIHIDENLSKQQAELFDHIISSHVGVMTVIHHTDTPHLMVIKYDPEFTSARELLDLSVRSGVHAELVGL